ncbi:hypothetical protein RW115_11925 [Macrococcus capreoli]
MDIQNTMITVKEKFKDSLKTEFNMSYNENKELVKMLGNLKTSELEMSSQKYKEKENEILEQKSLYIDLDHALSENDYYSDKDIEAIDKYYDRHFDLFERDQFVTSAKHNIVDQLNDNYDKAKQLLSDLEKENEFSNDYPVIYGLTTHERLGIDEFDKNLSFVTKNTHYSVLLSDNQQELIHQNEFRQVYENIYNPDNGNLTVLKEVLENKNPNFATKFNEVTSTNDIKEHTNELEME